VFSLLQLEVGRNRGILVSQNLTGERDEVALPASLSNSEKEGVMILIADLSLRPACQGAECRGALLCPPRALSPGWPPRDPGKDHKDPVMRLLLGSPGGDDVGWIPFAFRPCTRCSAAPIPGRLRSGEPCPPEQPPPQ